MPSNIASLEQLLLLAAGGVLWWLGGVIKKWLNDSMNRRRDEIDQKARQEKKIRELQEANWAMRAAMIRSGQWTLEDLEEFERKNNSSQ